MLGLQTLLGGYSEHERAQIRYIRQTFLETCGRRSTCAAAEEAFPGLLRLTAQGEPAVSIREEDFRPQPSLQQIQDCGRLHPLRGHAERMVADICAYQLSRRGRFLPERGRLNDPTMLCLQELKAWIISFVRMPVGEPATLQELNCRLRYVEGLLNPTLFPPGRHELSCLSLLARLRRSMQSVKQLVADHVRKATALVSLEKLEVAFLMLLEHCVCYMLLVFDVRQAKVGNQLQQLQQLIGQSTSAHHSAVQNSLISLCLQPAFQALFGNVGNAREQHSVESFLSRPSLSAPSLLISPLSSASSSCSLISPCVSSSEPSPISQTASAYPASLLDVASVASASSPASAAIADMECSTEAKKANAHHAGSAEDNSTTAALSFEDWELPDRSFTELQGPCGQFLGSSGTLMYFQERPASLLSFLRLRGVCELLAPLVLATRQAAKLSGAGGDLLVCGALRTELSCLLEMQRSVLSSVRASADELQLHADACLEHILIGESPDSLQAPMKMPHTVKEMTNAAMTAYSALHACAAPVLSSVASSTYKSVSSLAFSSAQGAAPGPDGQHTESDTQSCMQQAETHLQAEQPAPPVSSSCSSSPRASLALLYEVVSQPRTQADAGIRIEQKSCPEPSPSESINTWLAGFQQILAAKYALDEGVEACQDQIIQVQTYVKSANTSDRLDAAAKDFHNFQSAIAHLRKRLDISFRTLRNQPEEVYHHNTTAS
eukprot:g72263.t1